MIVDSINNGIVIDHLTAGKGLKVLSLLDINLKENTVALIMNASSKKYGRKDLVKIENKMDVDLTALGLIDPQATVAYILNGKIKEKVNLTLPKRVVNVVKCKNPRCVTTVEPGIPHLFSLVDQELGEYRCEYCDELIILKGEWKNEMVRG
jgi:aspartate carbamoyltransferase regulatory subunit